MFICLLIWMGLHKKAKSHSMMTKPTPKCHCQVFKLKFNLRGQRFHIEDVQKNVLGAIKSDRFTVTLSSLCPCLFSVFLKYSTHLEQFENMALLGRIGPKYKITKDKPVEFRRHQIVGQSPRVPRNSFQGCSTCMIWILRVF